MPRRTRKRSSVATRRSSSWAPAILLDRPSWSCGEMRIKTPALFLFIGADPHTDWRSGCVQLDKKGFVLTGAAVPLDAVRGDLWRTQGRTPLFLETSLPGVFAAGDVRSGSVKRCASAVGEGAMAVSFIHASLDITEPAKDASASTN